MKFSKNRNLVGTIEVFGDDKASLLGPVRALGRSDNAKATAKGNPSRSSVRPFGDTPTGVYAVRFSMAPMADRGTYGQNRVMYMDPLSGDALTAEDNGRSGLWLHGGSLRDGNLRPTYGCIRVDDDFMLRLYELSKTYIIDRLEVIDEQ